MGRAWLIISGTDASAAGTRFELKQGLTVLGGARGDLPLPASGNDTVHVWSEPPKLIFVGAGEAPRVNSHSAAEVALYSGDRIEWRGLAATFHCDPPHERLQEIPADWMHPEGAAPAATSASGASASGSPWPWVKAGLAAELSLSDAGAIKRWQDAAARGELDVPAAAREILAAAPGLGDEDPRLKERCARLMRELLAPVARRSFRPSEKSSHGCFMILLSQVLILVLVTLIVVAGLLVARTRYGQSIDAQLDRIIKLF